MYSNLRLKSTGDHLLKTMRQNLLFDGHRSRFITRRCPCFFVWPKKHSTFSLSLSHTSTHTHRLAPGLSDIRQWDDIVCLCECSRPTCSDDVKSIMHYEKRGFMTLMSPWSLIRPKGWFTYNCTWNLMRPCFPAGAVHFYLSASDTWCLVSVQILQD